MTTIEHVTLEVADPAAAEQFYTAFGLADRVRVRAGQSPTNGFRGYTLSVTVHQPSAVRALLDAAVAAGATVIKPASKSFWGFGGVVQAPDGAIWKVATTNKKDSDPSDLRIDKVVLLVGATDVAATKAFYVGQGLEVSKSFGRKYVEFSTPSSPVAFGLYGRKSLAKDAGVPAEGDGSHRIAVTSDAGSFVDPDGFAWEAA
ncbi:MAG: hypothetical protein AAGC49_10865 [Brevundimonas sp.]